MQLDVFFHGGAAGPADLAGRVVLVIDVLRASTVIATALSNGARAVIPFGEVDEALAASRSLDRAEVLLAGERRMVPVPGFDLGNSPREFTTDVVSGKTVLMTTSNGTNAIASVQESRGAQRGLRPKASGPASRPPEHGGESGPGAAMGTGGAADVVIGAYVNLTPVVAMLRAAARAGKSISIICAGSNGRFALEDAACAGRFVRGVSRRGIKPELGDGARVAAMIDLRMGADVASLLADCDHGRALAEAGYAADLAACAAVDSHPVVPVLQDRQVVRLGAARGR